MMSELKNILHVDDDDDVRLIVQIGLESTHQFRLTSCSNANEALDILSKKKQDLLLLDVMMPEKDGPTMVKEMKQREDITDTPFIYITAKVHPKSIATLLAHGALSVISKPFNPVELGSQIKKIWDNKQSGS